MFLPFLRRYFISISVEKFQLHSLRCLLTHFSRQNTFLLTRNLCTLVRQEKKYWLNSLDLKKIDIANFEPNRLRFKGRFWSSKVCITKSQKRMRKAIKTKFYQKVALNVSSLRFLCKIWWQTFFFEDRKTIRVTPDKLLAIEKRRLCMKRFFFAPTNDLQRLFTLNRFGSKF